ncbi:MAG: hypothetical protein WCL18_05010 [bacterium]
MYDTFKDKAKITFSYFSNIQGKYMIAEIDSQNKDNNIAQTNRFLFQRLIEKYEKRRLEQEYKKIP